MRSQMNMKLTNEPFLLRNEVDLRKLEVRHFDKRPDKFLNCLAVHVHKKEIRDELCKNWYSRKSGSR